MIKAVVSPAPPILHEPGCRARRSVRRRWQPAAIALLGLAFVGCRAQQQASPDSPRAPILAPDGAVIPAPAAAPPGATEGPPPAAPLDPGARALVIANGAETWVDAAAAEAEGYTLVDLSDDWTPFLFAEQRSSKGDLLPNRYRRVFLGLANDQLDEDGQPLLPGAKNYLELYGISPSMSVLHARFLANAERKCVDEQTKAALEAVDQISYVPPQAMRRDAIRLARIRAELESERKKARAKTLAELVEKKPEFGGRVRMLARRAAEKPALAAAEKRLLCEGFLKSGKHKSGVYDEVMQEAVKSFQQKHMIYESHFFRRQTMDALERELIDNDHRSAMRVLRERVVSATGILEDGSVTAKEAKELGAPQPPNLVDEYTAIAVKALGWDTPQGALDFFKRRKTGDFTRLRAAIKFPPRPDYYSPTMPLSIVIDRGDVWYDLAFDEKGERVPQPRKKFPSYTVFVEHKGKKLPLVRWRTTIGGWRAEQASDGYEYYRYKGSEVGPRVMRQIVAGPVWIAPESTPIRSLLKPKMVNGRPQNVVNYSELGPGYLSAYGLVAGYFVIPGKNGRGDIDNWIRAHGSAEYLSMYSPTGYSHGCHRLPNHLAIRAFSFILRHRKMRVVGDIALDFARQFLSKEQVYEIRLATRGFSYWMDPPVPIEVLEGEIKGEAKEPLLGYVPKPGQRYPGPPPAVPGADESTAGGGAGPAETPDKADDKPAEEGEVKP